MRRQNEVNLNTGPHFDALYAGPRREEMLPYPALATVMPLLVRFGRVLDVGCGWRQYYPILKSGCNQVCGVDFSEWAIRDARTQFPGGEWIADDFSERLLFQYSGFDAVVCLETLEHVESPARLIGEMRRVLVPGGVAVISVPYRDSFAHVEEHLWQFEEADWPQLMAGFSSHGVFTYRTGDNGEWEHFLVIARK